MGSELALPANNILDDIQWARAAAQAGILPAAYANRPGNLLVAAQLGRALGIAPMVAVTQIYVVDGKPSTSALLIAALVRKAGHKIRITGNTKACTVVIIREDDPDFKFEVTWELKKNANGNPSGEEAGLLAKDNWRKYPAGMLASRALTQCARIACPEALLGLAHTTEELNPDLATDEHGGTYKAERVTYEDMYAEQTRQATTLDELKQLQGEAKLAGCLRMVPTGEHVTLMDLFKEKYRELKELHPNKEEEENEGSAGGSEVPEASVSEADTAEAADRSGQVEKDDPAYATYDGNIVDAEVVDG